MSAKGKKGRGRGHGGKSTKRKGESRNEKRIEKKERRKKVLTKTKIKKQKTKTNGSMHQTASSLSEKGGQGTKKFRPDSPRLVDFVFELVEFILYLPDGQVKVFGKIFL